MAKAFPHVIVGLGIVALLGAAGPAATVAPPNPARSLLASPSARYGAGMDYDAATGNIVLSGGTLNGIVDQGTWIWDGTTWTQLSPSPSPPSVTDGMMAYDPAMGRMLLYSGNNQGHGLVRETWTWNGTTWSQLSP